MIALAPQQLTNKQVAQRHNERQRIKAAIRGNKTRREVLDEEWAAILAALPDEPAMNTETYEPEGWTNPVDRLWLSASQWNFPAVGSAPAPCAATHGDGDSDKRPARCR